MTKKDIGVGVIGVGMGASMLALNTDTFSRMEVRALCATTKEKLESMSRQHGIPYCTTDYRELVARKDIDVIGVFSPDHLHYKHCKAALQEGKHVICTKPLTNNLEHAKELVEMVRNTGLKFLVGQTMRYDPQMVSAKQFYDRGDAGRIIFAEAHYVHDMRPVFEFTPWRLNVPQDLMYGGVCHPVDVLRWFLGDIEELHAYGNKGGLETSSGIIDNFILNMKFTDETIARVLGIYGVIEPPEPMMKLSIYGTKMNLQSTFTDNKGGALKLVWDDIEYRPTSVMEFPAEHGIDVYGHTRAVLRYSKHFEECIMNDLEPSPGVVDGAKTIAAGHAAAHSIEKGGVMKVFNDF